MTSLSRPILAGLDLANFNLSLQLGDLSNADAVRRARGDSGSSISWIVGHLLSLRCTALGACGVERENPYEEHFSFHSPATDGSGYPDIASLRDDWRAIHDQLRSAVVALGEDDLLRPSTLPSAAEDGDLLSGLSFIQWHEAYHVGVIGLLRVQWGYRHTHELALETMTEDRPPAR